MSTSDEVEKLLAADAVPLALAEQSIWLIPRGFAAGAGEPRDTP